MNFQEYQDLANRTSRGEHSSLDRLTNGALGVGGEAGEVVELVKKHRYHGHALDKVEMAKELGDVLWYLAEICTSVGISLNEVAEGNINKLRARYPEGFSEQRSRVREGE